MRKFYKYPIAIFGVSIILGFGEVVKMMATATTLPATAITDVGATLNGNVDPAPDPSHDVEFEIDDDPGFGSSTIIPFGSVNSAQPVSVPSGVLTANTMYSFRVIIDPLGTPVMGGDLTFVTLSTAPTAVTDLAASPDSESAISLAWTDVGDEDGYLILASDASTPAAPTNGVALPADDLDLSDGTAVVSKAMDATGHTFTGLAADDQLFFSIYSYTLNTASNANYAATSDDDTYTWDDEPTAAPGTFVATANGGAQIDLSWLVEATADNYLILANTTGTFTDPTDAIAPIVDNDLSDGSATVIKNGVDNSHLFTGLTEFTEYFFAIYSYSVNTEAVPNYNTTESTDDAIPCTPPVNPISSFAVSNVEDDRVTLTWDNGVGGDRALIIGRAINPVNVAPQTGIHYSDGGGTGSGPYTFGSGTDLGSGNFVVFEEAGAIAIIDGLTPDTDYYFTAYAFFHGSGTDHCYNPVAPPTLMQTTACAPPSTQASGMSVSVPTETTLNISWTAGNGGRTLVLAKAGSAVDADPVPGMTYSASTSFGTGDQIGTGNYVVFADVPAPPETITGLNPATTYHFAAYEYFDADKCYNITSPSTASGTTSCAAPSTQATAGMNSLVGASTATVSWALGGDGDGYIVMISPDGAPIPPENSMNYSGDVNSDYSMANDIDPSGDETKIVFRGLGSTVPISGLDPTTTYDVLIYEYNNTDNCYNLVSPASTMFTTAATDQTTTLTAGTGVSSFSSEDDTSGEWVDAFSFTITDLGPDGRNTDISAMIFRPGVGNEIAGWMDVIAGARLIDDDAPVNTRNASSIDSDFITFTGIPKGNGDLGQIDEASAKVYTLQIYLDNDLPMPLKSTIDNMNFVFDLHENDITADANDSQVVDDANTNSDVVGGPNNEVEVSVSQLVFTTDASPATLFAGDGVGSTSVVTAHDGNGNTDLDYTGTFTVTNTAALGMNNVPTTWSSGTLTFATNFTFTDPGTTKLRVNDTSGAGASLAESADDYTVNTSNQSDIIVPVAFSYPENIPYEIAVNQGGTVMATSAEVMQLEIRDGGAGSDSDNLGTELTDIDIDLTDANGVVNQVALFDGATLIQQQPAGGTMSFNGIGSAMTTAPDDGSKILSVRVTFNSTVNDNSQFSFAVSAATANPSTSTFAAADAGGASSSTTGDDNRIEVTASVFVFTTQPSPFARLGESFTSQGLNIPALEARDALNNMDVDYSPLATITNTDAINMSTSSINWASGILTFPGTFTYTSFTGGDPGAGDLTVTVGGINATSTAVLVDGTAPDVDVQGVENINPAGPTDLIVKNGDIVSFTATFTENDQIDEGTPPTITIGSIIMNAAMVKSSNTVWTYDWNVPTGNDGIVAVSIAATDRSGYNVTAATGDVSFEIDNTAPTLSNITIVSNSTDPAYTSDPEWAKVGDDVTLTFTVDDDLLADPVITIDGNAAVTTGTNPNYTGTYTMMTGDTEGVALGFTIDYTDAAGNIGTTGTAVSGSGAGTSVTFDETLPSLPSLLPDNNFLSVPIDAPLTITLNDNLIPNINSTAQIRIREFVGNAIFESYDNLSSNPQIDFTTPNEVTITPSMVFLNGTEYYVEIDGVVAGAGGNAIYDKAGNPYDGFINNSTWKFRTFDNAVVTDIVGNASNSICVETPVTIMGDFFAAFSQIGSETAGVTQVEFIEEISGDIVLGTGIVVVDDNTVTVQVPPGLDNDVRVRLTKATENTGIGTNPTVVSATSTDVVAVGPSTAEFMFAMDGTGRMVVCSDGITTSNILVEIIGGNGPFTLNYQVNGGAPIPITNYNSGDYITVDPPNEGDNDYSIVSVTDANGCNVPVSGFITQTITIDQEDRSFVDIDAITTPSNPICLVGLNTGDPVTLTGTITGTNQQVKWSTVNGTGIFTESGTNEYIFTSTDGTLTANYELTAQDLALPELIIRLESINSTAPCNETSDQIELSFTTSQSANLGGDQEVCLTVGNPDITLDGTLGGGAVNGYWEAISTGPNPGGDGTWSVGPGSMGAPVLDGDDGMIDGIMSTVYTMGTNDVLNGSVQIRLVPGGGTCGTPLDDIISINLQNLPTPAVENLDMFDQNPCVNSTFVNYEVTFTSGSSYAWTIIPDATIMPAPNPDDVGEFSAGQGTSSAFVDWKDIPGDHKVQVVETNQFGCISNPVQIDVTIHDIPVVAFEAPLARSYSKDDSNVGLIGDYPPISMTPFNMGLFIDSLFSGAGVIQDQGGNFFFDPDVAGAGATHPLTFTFTDEYGCTNSITENFDVFDISGSVVRVDDGSVILDDYCEDFGSFLVELSPLFPIETGYEFDHFEGPGVTDNGDGTALFDPQAAADSVGQSIMFIDFFRRLIANPSDVSELGEQSVIINELPILAKDFTGSEFCNTDGSVSMNRDLSINPLGTFSYSVVGGDPNGLIVAGAGPTFTFHPANEVFADDDFTAHTIQIEYYYMDDKGCDDTEIFEVEIFKRPDPPTAPDVFGCVVSEEDRPSLTVSDPIEGAIVNWYDSPSLDTRLFTGLIFDPNVTTEGTTVFYVTQTPPGENTCESIDTEVSVTITTVDPDDITISNDASCQSQPTPFFSSYSGSPAITAWSWDFGDPNASAANNVSTQENPIHTYGVAGNYTATLTVTDEAFCQTTESYQVSVGEIPQSSFEYEIIAQGIEGWFYNSTPDLALSTLETATWSFFDWVDDTGMNNILIDSFTQDATTFRDTLVYSFTNPGRKVITLEVATNQPCIATIYEDVFIVPTVTVTPSNPYFQDFESNNDGWISWGEGEPLSKWRKQTPPASIPDRPNSTSTLSWYTDQNVITFPEDGSLSNRSIVYTANFDISALERPVLTFDAFLNNGQLQGAYVQFSTTGLFGDDRGNSSAWSPLGDVESGINWYDLESDNFQSTDFGNSAGVTWQRTDSDWVTSIHSLTDIPLEGRQTVVIRFVFESEDNENLGFAFDDIRIGERERVVLLEHFESTSSEQIEDVNSFPTVGASTNEIVKIHYRTGFGGTDAAYENNPADANARALFYDISSPDRQVMDGDNTETDPFNEWNTAAFGTKSLTDPKVEFTSFTAVQDDITGTVEIDATFKALDNLGELVAHVVVVEDEIDIASDGQELYVMRKMLPSAAGTPVTSLAFDESFSIPTQTWTPLGLESDYSVIVFVQQLEPDPGNSFSPVLQAELIPVTVDAQQVTGIEDFGERTLNIYPNPASERVTIAFESMERKTVRIFDQFGKMIQSKEVVEGAKSVDFFTSEYASGVYFAQVESAQYGVIRKKFILSH